MADILVPNKALSVNPLKVSEPVGASLVFLGLAKSMPLEHGARGCTSFNKLFFMRHFREPIALQTTAMDQVTTIIGADDNVIEALRTIGEKDKPDIVGLITTGLSQAQGADVPSTIKAFRDRHPECENMTVIPVNASDMQGSLESGFALAVEAIIHALIPDRHLPVRNPRQVTILCSSMLTPGDIEELKSWVQAFGLTPIMLPDVGDSLDGHLIPEGYSTLSYGGTAVGAIGRMNESIATLVVGASLNKTADILKARTGIPDHRFDHLMGLEASDAFTLALSEISGKPVPTTIERQRAQLQDAMVDCQFRIGGLKTAIAADPDQLSSFVHFFKEMGAEISAAVASFRTKRLSALPIDEVVVGDLEDLETMAKHNGAELLVTNSHGVEVAKRLGLPLLRAGFPLYDIYGGYARGWIGYRAGRQALFDIANLSQSHHQELRPYRSIFWQGGPRETETAFNDARGAAC